MTAPSRAPVAVVTGAARGIGRRIAAHFIDSGYFVVVTDIDEDGALTCAHELGAARAERMDVCDGRRVNALLETVATDHDGIDVFVNNAGRMTQGPFANTTRDDFDAMIEVNIMGIFNCVQAVAPLMMPRKRGAIINLASVSSVRGGGAVGNVWYGATKAAPHSGATRSNVAARHRSRRPKAGVASDLIFACGKHVTREDGAGEGPLENLSPAAVRR